MRCAGVHFDFRGQVRLLECLFQDVLVIGRTLIVTGRDRNQELRLTFRGLKMWTIRRFGHESAAMEGADRSDAIRYGGRRTKRDRSTHAVTLCADLPVCG